MGIGARLAEERRRLGLSQEQFAEIGGATKRSQINWEKDDQSPNAKFLAAVASVGVDVLYVVTGVRGSPVEETLTPRERALLDNYMSLDDSGRKAIDRQVLLEAQHKAITARLAGKKAA